MGHIYTEKKQAEKHEASPSTLDAHAPVPDALRTGSAAPTREQLGHRVDLPDAMREKMESAFGADLSGLKLYESQAVAEAGANAMARGSDIAFAPGMLDFTSYGGKALLGHEISHVVSQARGEVTGGGFLNDRALEARADREGAMAAAGQTVAMPSAPMSAVSAAPAAGPMQADKAEEKVRMGQSMQESSALQIMNERKKDPENYTKTKEYKAAMKQLEKGRKQESKYRKKLTPEGQKKFTSVGMDMLYLLQAFNRNDNDSYLKDADMAMDVLGDPDDAMKADLSKTVGIQYSLTTSQLSDDRRMLESLQDQKYQEGGMDRIHAKEEAVKGHVQKIDDLKDLAKRRGLTVPEMEL